MNPDRQVAESGLNGQSASDLLARHDSLKCSTFDASNTNGTPSAAVAPLEPENDASQGIETSNATSSKDTAQQQSSSYKRLQHQRDSTEGIICIYMHAQLNTCKIVFSYRFHLWQSHVENEHYSVFNWLNLISSPTTML